MQLWPWRGAVSCSVLVVAGLLALPGGAAQAFDLFGLFGTNDKPPAASPKALPYVLTFDISGDRKAVEQPLKDASQLYRLRQEAPLEGDSLVRRAQADFGPMLDALWGTGYYNATLSYEIGGAALTIGGSPSAASRAAEAYRAREPVPVRVVVNTGPLFTLRRIEVDDARTGRSFPQQELPSRIVGLNPGDPARAADLRAARARMVDYFRSQSRPLAKAASTEPVVYHPAQAMDITYTIDPGPVAPFGEIGVSGTESVDPAVVRSFIYLEPGDPYSPKALADTRKSVGTIQALGSVRIREAEALDAHGRLPVFVEVTERKPRVVGFSARYSTVDGPALHGYWEHRNLFGGAERLRLESDLFLAPRNDGTRLKRVQDLEPSDIGGRFSASFIKPALSGSRNDLLLDALVERNRTGGDRYGGYTTRFVNGTAFIRHRFSETFSMQAGTQLQKGQTSDVLGKIDYFLVGLPASLMYDSTDRPLDPTRGARVNATVTPYPSFLGSTVGMTVGKVEASAYYALDDDARYVLAGRIGLGSVLGADLDEIPANFRFFAGGGGSVRGYRYRSLGPQGPFGYVVGGRSLLEASLEARIKITDTIGVVPFLDAGNAFESSYPDFGEELRVSAGLGLRYYTAIGPIRLDIAAPLNARPGDKPVSLYVSIGQAF
ncbi:autotransporter assembly complex protein TamA [Microvirga thermotolerans]|uniref:BamA/TamA family outer membrane protein n=1 Tax=Microvirga thermotolerans TaxID=2651334 RepID=A0A5P9K0E9_9HYPH|nr:autotransporter assembly complex family protein [Microvirga thermotolerans]QFU17478.1 BamA/TamA family outer membrane protein [Microvirga thermotolerans]